MCIRDSYRRVVEETLDFVRREMRHERGGFYSSYDADSEGCLLYTSDAADDLLCVDLGGRRIIKKKKQNQRHSPRTVYKH